MTAKTSVLNTTDSLAAPADTNNRLKIIAALAAVYVIWGSTYLGMAIAVETMPPFMMVGLRFGISSILLFSFLMVRGTPLPSREQIRNAAVIGMLMLGGGTGAVAFAEQWVESGLAALMVAVVPLWVALFSGLWGKWPARLEWVGIGIGLVGVALLNLEGGMRANPLGALVLVLGPMCWAFASIWSRHIAMPQNGLMGSAIQMMGGAVVLMLISIITRENMTELPTLRSGLAFVYLTTVGSLIGFTAYMYLLKTVRPVLATSYAYVNPAVAVLLGVTLADEKIGPIGIVAMFIILGSVALIALKPAMQRSSEKEKANPA